MSGEAVGVYSGVDNLEIMEEARRYNAFLQELVTSGLRRDDTVLDFGAGTGVLARPLAQAGYRVRCVEPDPRLRARLAAAGLETAATLDAVPPASLDFIYTVNVLEHIADDAATVAALRARLRPGGRLLVYVPAFPLLYSSMDRKVGHLRRYRRDRLLALLRDAGLAIESIAHCDCLGFFATLLFKLVGNADGALDRRALAAYDRYVFPLSRVFDALAYPWLGKNLIARAHCPTSPSHADKALSHKL